MKLYETIKSELPAIRIVLFMAMVMVIIIQVIIIRGLKEENYMYETQRLDVLRSTEKAEKIVNDCILLEHYLKQRIDSLNVQDSIAEIRQNNIANYEGYMQANAIMVKMPPFNDEPNLGGDN